MNASLVFGIASAKSFNMDGMPAGTVRMNKNELFAELKGLNEYSYNFGLAKYADDTQARDRLYDLFKRLSPSIARNKRWRIASQKTLDSACELAIDMHIYPQLSYCKTCGGSGSKTRGKTCDNCGGSGRKSMTNVAVGERLGVSEGAVRETWNYRLDILYRKVAGWEAIAFEHINRRRGA